MDKTVAHHTGHHTVYGSIFVLLLQAASSSIFLVMALSGPFFLLSLRELSQFSF